MRKWFKSPRDPILTPTPELLLNCIKLGRAELSLLWNFKLNLDHRPACCRARGVPDMLMFNVWSEQTIYNLSSSKKWATKSLQQPGQNTEHGDKVWGHFVN